MRSHRFPYLVPYPILGQGRALYVESGDCRRAPLARRYIILTTSNDGCPIGDRVAV